METYCWKVYCKSAIQLDSAFHSFDQLRDIGMARIETAATVDDANHRSRKSVFAIPGRLDEDLSEKEREVSVAITRKAASQAAALDWFVEIIVFQVF